MIGIIILILILIIIGNGIARLIEVRENQELREEDGCNRWEEEQDRWETEWAKEQKVK